MRGTNNIKFAVLYVFWITGVSKYPCTPLPSPSAPRLANSALHIKLKLVK